MGLKDCYYIIKEYGFSYLFYRSLYTIKLLFLRRFRFADKIFEKDNSLKRINLLKVDKNALEDFVKNLSNESKVKLIDNANNALEGRILGFSSVELDYENPIRWNYNPITQKEVDIGNKWYEIADFDIERGDIKVIWEASRFTHFYLFARAYMLTKDIKYYNGFSQQLQQWLDKNPYGYGANYKCGQECSLRMINALMTFSIFKEYNLVTDCDENNIKELICRCYKKIRSNFFYAYKCIRNNHTISELCGIIIGAWCCDDTRVLKRAYKLLNKEIQKQFFEDGGYRQYSFNYQRLALQLIEFVLKIEPITGYGLTDENIKTIINSAELLYQVQNNDGDVPNYGSNDGALIFPVHSCSYRDFRPTIDGIFKLLKKEDVYSSGEFAEEYLWFSNNEEEIRKVNLQAEGKEYSKFGCYTMTDKNSKAIVFVQKFSSRPAQMDQLHLDLWYKNDNILCDCGTYSYASDLGKKLALTDCHNTVKVDDVEQMKKKGPFFIYAWTEGKVLDFRDDVFEGEIRSKNGYMHNRHISKLKGGYEIVDRISPSREYKVIFHTAHEVKLNNNDIELWKNERLIATIQNQNADVDVSSEYRSLYYLKKEEITKIVFLPKGKVSTTKIIFKEN